VNVTLTSLPVANL